MKKVLFVIVLLFGFFCKVESRMEEKDDNYYLAYKKSRSASSEEQKAATAFLVKSLDEAAPGLRGQILGYLQDFTPADFDAESRAALTARLAKPNSPH